MRRAFISDIHGNLQALEAVLARIDQLGIERVDCLGDVVGYGPDPEACLDLVRERCSFTLMGNHDWAVLHEPVRFNPVAAEAIRCSKEFLAPRCLAVGEPGCERWRFLESLPDEHREGEWLFVHASPRDHLTEYLLESDVALGFPSKRIVESFAMIGRVCVVGHTHRPGVFTEDLRFLKPAELAGGVDLARGKFILNDGSVGQPRDGDVRACWLEVDGTRARWHRTAYDYHETMKRLRQRGCLNEICAKRLAQGR